MRQQCPAGDGTGHHLCPFNERRRQEVDEVLGESPDERWLLEELMGIQVDLAVIAIAIVEVPINPQHVIPLEISECFGSHLVVVGRTGHGWPPPNTAACGSMRFT